MKNKKAFTVVELVIVIAIIAILAAVLIPTFAAIIKKANVSKDQQLIKNLNTALATDRASNNNQNHMTMTDALKAAEAFGYDVSKINASATDNTILWDQFNDVFCYYDKDKNDVDYIPEVNVAVGDRLHAGSYGLWKIYNAKSEPVPAYGDQTYSIYLGEGAVMFAKESNGQYKFKVGVDVGKNTDVLNILYDAGSATDKHSVIIRTDSMNAKLEVIAPYDDVKHFGIADTVTLTSISATSYYEYGHVMVVNIKTGRLIITNYPGAKVEGIILSATDNKYDNIILAIQEGAKLPTLIRREALTTDPNPADETTKILVATVQKVNADGSVVAGTEEFIYLYGEHTAKEQDKGYVGVSELGTLILEALSGSTEPGVTDAIKVPKTGTLADVKSAAISNSFETESTNVFLINDKFDLLKFAYMVNNGVDTTGKTYKLTADIDLEGTPWTPIGYITDGDWNASSKYDYNNRHNENGLGGMLINDSKPFYGVFDGNGHTIYNLKPVQEDGKNGLGLFGFAYGTQYNEYVFGTQSAKDSMLLNSTIQKEKISESNYVCTIKNVNLENVTIGAENNKVMISGGVAGVAYGVNIDSCNVRNIAAYTANVSGGIVGTASASVIKNCVNGTASAPGFIRSQQNTGGIVGTLENYFYVGGSSHTVIYNCRNYSSVSVSSTNAGGIVGLGQGYGGDSVIIDSTNSGKISISKTSGDSIYSAGGISGNGASISMFYHCINEGSIEGPSTLNISQPVTSKGLQLGGISCYMTSGYYYNCVNNGSISGNANYMGGLISATHDDNTNITLVNCGNTGTLINSFSDGKSSSICGAGSATISIEGQVDKLSYVQEYLNQLNSNTDLTHITVSDKQSGVLIIPAGCSTIKVNSNVCEKLEINEATANKIVLNCPGIDVEIINNIGSANVVVEEAKSVSISSSGVAGSICIGNVATVTNNGTISAMCFFSQNMTSPITAVNNGTISRNSNYAVSFYAEPVNNCANNLTVNFMNNGTIAVPTPYALGISSGENNLLRIHNSSSSTIVTRNNDGTGNGNLALAFNANGAIIFSRDPNATMQCGSYIHENSNGSQSVINDADFSFPTD